MIGEKLGRYNLLEEIGTGSMGTVYRAEDRASGRIVAVKLVRAKVLYDSSRRERFLQDLLSASQIRHKGICPILEIGDDEDDFLIVTPFLQGEPLAHHLKGRLMPWRSTLKMGIAIADAMGAVHAAGAIHRALKPSNIWIHPDGEVVLTDCCVGRFTEMDRAGDLTSTEPRQDFADTIIPMSALAYMSPEQVRGETVDYRSDIFALGAILYELLSDRHPFEARNSLSRISAILDSNPAPLTSKRQDLPKELDAILRKAMAGRPGDRYVDVQEFSQALRSVREKERDSEIASAGFKPGARRRFALLKIVAGAGIFITIIALILYLLLVK